MNKSFIKKKPLTGHYLTRFYEPVMLHVVLDTVVDVWNKTDVKLAIFQLKILNNVK